MSELIAVLKQILDDYHDMTITGDSEGFLERMESHAEDAIRVINEVTEVV